MTRAGLALANIYAAMEVGIARFDASLAGIGGCPHAPGASGNASTEDLAYMLASMGVDTGIDLTKLFALRGQVGEWLRRRTAARRDLPRGPSENDDRASDCLKRLQ